MLHSTSIRTAALLLVFCVLFGTFALEPVRGCADEGSGTITKEQTTRWADELLEAAINKKVSKKGPEIPLTGKVILAYHECYYNKGCVVYGKYDPDGSKGDPTPGEPFFQPLYSSGTPIFDVPASTWASTIEECNWLIVYGGFEVDRRKEYYMDGSDRVSVATRVYVINPKKSRIVYYKDLGTDVPGNRTDHTSGKVDHKAAEAEIMYLLTGSRKE